ncbi:HEAT repeat-containing protein 6-like [Mizuhopecten yessoensis]|uniref:HEAT repeat-containing protein 6 n=1 Tax=Mizuhopecten yessoensis TaxID=6573 RepID=A0A210PTJ4_MIZYE|nr:HEAT repeat-containing protein 6-like [Mizuhopecten yessoensis]OWF39764.1 HEAT repeat-containing protein 6 [Mizuhopecten yessoensis]
MEDADGSLAERERFLQCFKRLNGFNYRRDDEASRTNFNLLLDEINSMEYYMRIVREDEANRLITKFCTVVPLYEERFLVKVCQAIFNFTAKQQLTLTEKTLHLVTEYLISALQRCQPWTRSEILLALGAVVYECCGQLTKYHDTLLNKQQGVLIPLLSDPIGDEAVLRGVIQCIENLTIKVAGQSYLEDHHTLTCFEVFMNILHTVRASKIETNIKCKVLICSLRGLQNILGATKIMPTDQLGSLLAGIRTYMFHGLSSFPVNIPERLYPTPLRQYDTSPSGQSTPHGEQKPEEETQGASKSQASKKSKKKKAKKSPEKSNKSQDGNRTTLTSDNGQSEGQGSVTTVGLDAAVDTRPVWAKIGSSDSDYSDTEGGQGSRLRSHHTKVRQCALVCLHTVIKTTDRRLMFGYWSSFIPDSSAAGNSPQVQTLFTIILKDPSPKCRMGALAALTALVDGTKTFLAAAEDSDQITAFTPFSSILGSTIRELHRCLLLALVSENYPLTLTQLIKCIAILISNVPYQRMKPGLLSRVIKLVRNFLNHRDPNVRVACLTCFGAVAAIQPPLMEICHIMQPSIPPLSASLAQPAPPVNQQPGDVDSQSESRNSRLGSAQGNQLSESSGNSKADYSTNDGQLQSLSPEVVTPPVGQGSGSGSVSPGALTPVYSDKLLQAHARDTSWLIKLCMRNILPFTDHHGNWTEPHFEPLPVRLESLQVLAHLTKGYFPIIRNGLAVLRDLIHKCIQDSDQVVRLHTIKLLDVLTQVILQDVQAAETDGPGNRVNIDLAKEFWVFMLMGPLPSILQMEANNAVRATSCDCISNVGPEVFAVLPMDKRILCITLVLGLTSDDDRIVRSAAVRAVGVYVLYPCLREDVSFIADAANSILKSMADSSLNVRLKTAWSLANLCDALVLNKTEGDVQFLQDFSNLLLQKLFTTATKACQDSDKVRSNAVRALGNLMRYLPRSSLEKCTFKIPVEEGVKALVKNISSGTMKVRWNACYAVSNLFKNSLLNQASTEWMKDIILALCAVVRDCKNFKVRINAALALGSPPDRDQYGTVDLFISVWEALIRGLETAEEITDFTEYKYRGNLNNQICTTIIHLVTMTQYNDLDRVGELLEVNFDLLLDNLDKFQQSQGKKTEFEAECVAAQQRLAMFGDSKLSHRQGKAVERLTQLAFADEIVDRKQEKSAFVQTYD